MADTKISELAELTIIAEDDYFPVVDASETATKRVKFQNLHQSETRDHIMQSDNTDQAISAAGITGGQVITFDTDVDSHGIVRTSSSRFTIATPGTYLITFSGVAEGKLNEYIAVWLKTSTGGGAATNLADSNTLYRFKANDMSTVIAVSFLVHFIAGDYFEFWTWGSATTSFWNYTAAVVANPGVTPARPACPSIIFTANRV